MLQNLIDSISKIDSRRGYWFVRTDKGINFETYIQNDFIGIGWNEITVNDLQNKTAKEVKAKIADVKKIDTQISKGKSQASAIYNKLKRFQALKKGDVIVIPSNNSSRFAFGIILDDKIYVDLSGSYKCEYFKRRKVQWIETKNVRDLDPIFYQIKNTRHAISNINDYASYIDSETEVLYKKGDYSYYVLEVETKDEINVKPLVSLVSNLQSLLEIINLEFELNENTDDSSIKLNLQSPGKIVIKLKKGTSLILLAVLLAINSGCSTTDLPITGSDLTKLEKINDINVDLVDSTNKDMDTLEVNINKLNSFK